MTSLALQNGKMPVVGLGTWKLANEICADVVYTAIKVGYRLIDCACDYGNEKEVGEGIKRALDDGTVVREVCSQCWSVIWRVYGGV